MKVVSLSQKFALFSELWTPKILDECNGQLVKIAKVKGEFVWHEHKDEDEFFYVIKGKLYIDLPDKTLELNEGEMVVIPREQQHRPRTDGDEAWILLIEPVATKHTGEKDTDFTVNHQDSI